MKNRKMTRMNRLCFAGVAALFILIAGCTTARQTENMLAAAGFKMVSASTPQQEADLKKLPVRKLSRVHRNGKLYFVYPDAKRNVLYVGQQAQYDQYQKLYQQGMQAGAEQEEAAAQKIDDWANWGVGGD
jgi:hypothetical protein